MDMKVLLLSLALICSFSVLGQTYDIFLAGTEEQREDPIFGEGAMPRVDGEIVYQCVVPMEGLSKQEVYNRAVNSLGKLFPKYMSKITSQDEVNHVIKGQGKFEFVYKRSKVFNFKYGYLITFNICVECKDERYRITIDNIYFTNEYGVSSASNYEYSDEKQLDKKGHVKNTNGGCIRIGIIASYLIPAACFEDYMNEKVNKKVINDDW